MNRQSKENKHKSARLRHLLTVKMASSMDKTKENEKGDTYQPMDIQILAHFRGSL